MTTSAGIEELHPSPLRPRGKLPRPSRSLAATVSEHGPLAPVLVRSHPPGYEILSNTETWLAAQQAGHHQVPIEVRDHLTDEQARAILDAGDGRNPPDPIDEAEPLEDALTLRHGTGERLRGAVAALASELGLSRSHAAHTLRLLQLPSDVQQLVRDGLLSRGHALAVLRLDGARARRRARHPAKALGTRDRSPRPRPRPHAAARAGPPDIARLERTLSDALGTATRLETSRGELVIRVVSRTIRISTLSPPATSGFSTCARGPPRPSSIGYDASYHPRHQRGSPIPQSPSTPWRSCRGHLEATATSRSQQPHRTGQR